MRLSLLKLDGTIGGGYTGPVFAGDGHARSIRADGTGLGWPVGSVYRTVPAGWSVPSLADVSGMVSDAAWTLDGTCVWIATGFPNELHILRAPTPATVTPIASISGEFVPPLQNSDLTGEFFGLAPDDSAAVLRLGRLGPSTERGQVGTLDGTQSVLVNSATGAELDLTDAFAGWLATPAQP